MFHQVNNDNRPIYTATPTKVFEQICRFLHKYTRVIHFSEFETQSTDNKKPTVVISFDDGHYDIIDHALPVLKRYDLKFNINVDTEILSTGLPQDNVRIYDVLNQTTMTSYEHPEYFKEPVNIQKDTSTEFKFSKVLVKLSSEKRREFSDHVFDALGNDDMSFSKVISKDDVKYLNNCNVEFGSHSHTHAMLPNQSEDEVFAELVESKKILEGLTDKPINIIAYPNGLSNEKIDAISRKASYEYLLYTGDLSNSLVEFDKNRIYRINMYHQSLSESLANIFGVHLKLRTMLGTILGRK